MDDSFGPQLFGHFDFTILFEHVLFYIVPSAILLFSVPYYCYKTVKGRRLVRPGWLLWAKLAVAVALAAVQLASLIYWKNSPLNSRVGQAASILSFISSIGIIIIVYASHTYFVHSALFLAIWLTATLLCDIATTRTYFNRTGLETIARLTCATVPLKAALVILEEISKRPMVIAEEVRNSLNDEAVAGFWNKSTFFWVNPLLLFGFSHVIQNETLPDIGPQFNSENLYQAFEQCWARRRRNSRHALLKAFLSAVPWPFLYAFLPRLLLVGCLFSQPFLLQDVVNVVSGNSLGPGYISKSNENGALIVATVLVFSGKAVSIGTRCVYLLRYANVCRLPGTGIATS